MYNYLHSMLIESLGERTFLPHNAGVTRNFEISFSGWVDNFTVVSIDHSIKEWLSVVLETLKNVMKIYEKEYAFSEPCLGYKPQEKIFYLKIGLLELEKAKPFLDDKQNVQDE